MPDQEPMRRHKKENASGDPRSCPDYERFWSLLNTDPSVGQSYETLLSSLHLLDATETVRTILVTSARPEEGKTTILVNLALTVLLAGKKPLVIDVDLRRPSIHRLLGLENTRGVVDLLKGDLDVPGMIQPVEAEEKGGVAGSKRALGVITSGKASLVSLDATALARLRQPLNHLRGRYDLILLDSPPALAVSDALHLAPLVDGVVLVLSAGATLEKDARCAKERLEQAGGQILGGVLNRFDEKWSGQPFHPYYAYYHRPRA